MKKYIVIHNLNSRGKSLSKEFIETLFNSQNIPFEYSATKNIDELNNIISREILLSKSNTMKNFNKKKYYDLIFANILFGPLTSLAPRLKFISKPNSFIVLSGLLSNQITNIVNRYKMFGFKLKKKIIINGWGTVIMRRQF